MRNRLVATASAALLALAVVAPPALAVEPMKSEGAASGAMHKDSMASERGKSGAMMHKDGMKKDGMKKDSMSKESMGKDSMGKDSMGKH